MKYKPYFDADGNFIHPCCICGKQAGLGFGVSLRNDKLGQWYCAQCNPHRPASLIGKPENDGDPAESETREAAE